MRMHKSQPALLSETRSPSRLDVPNHREGLDRQWLFDRLASISERCAGSKCDASFANPLTVSQVCGECREISCSAHAIDDSHMCDDGALHALKGGSETPAGFRCCHPGKKHNATGTSLICPTDGASFCVLHIDSHLRICVKCTGFKNRVPQGLSIRDPRAITVLCRECLPLPKPPAGTLEAILPGRATSWSATCASRCGPKANMTDGAQLILCGACDLTFCADHVQDVAHTCPNNNFHIITNENAGQDPFFSCAGDKPGGDQKARGVSMQCAGTDVLLCNVHASAHVLCCANG